MLHDNVARPSYYETIELEGNPYGKIDCYGRPHDKDGNTQFLEFRRPRPDTWLATDALIIYETDIPYFQVQREEAMEPDRLPDGRIKPFRAIVTSPNRGSRPRIPWGFRGVRARGTGRFASDDFTLHPQWVNMHNIHLAIAWIPYKLRQLGLGVMTHQVRYGMEIEPGTRQAGRDMGRWSSGLAKEFAEAVAKMQVRIKEVEGEQKWKLKEPKMANRITKTWL